MSKNYLLQTAKLFLLASIGLFSNAISLKAQSIDFSSLNLTWKTYVSPNRVDTAPLSHTVVDSKGNVYQFISSTEGHRISRKGPFAIGSRDDSYAILIKYDASGRFQWQQTIKGLKVVTANAITIADDIIYVVGTYNNDKKKGHTRLIATGSNGAGSINTAPKIETDLYLAKYDTEGNILALNTVVSSRSRTEVPYDIVCHKDKVYVCGESSGTGVDPEYNLLEVSSGDENYSNKISSFAFVFGFDSQDLSINRIYSLKPTEGFVISREEETWVYENGAWKSKIETVYDTHEDRVVFNALLADDNGVYVVGSTDANHQNKPLYYDDGDVEFKVNNKNIVEPCKDNFTSDEPIQAPAIQTTILAKLDLNSSSFSQIKAYEDIIAMPYTLASDSENIYIGLNTTSGLKTSAVNGAAVLEVKSTDFTDKRIFPVGSNDEMNVIKAIAVVHNPNGNKLLFGGDYSTAFTVGTQDMPEKGGGDSFVGSIDLASGNIKKIKPFGSNSIEELQDIVYDASNKRFYFTGYFRRENSAGTPGELQGRYQEKYYLCCVNAETEGFRAIMGSVTNKDGHRTTAVESLNTVQAFSVTGNTITWNVSGRFVVFDLDGSIVEQGQASQGATTTLNRGNVYIVKLNGKGTKIIL